VVIVDYNQQFADLRSAAKMELLARLKNRPYSIESLAPPRHPGQIDLPHQAGSAAAQI
jgi:hypothetical protein